MTIFSKNFLGGMAPLLPPGYSYALRPLGNFLRTPLQVAIRKRYSLHMSGFAFCHCL